MKKLLTLGLTLIALLTLLPAARADVIWEPDNRFYERHSDECEYIDRRYYANGPDGFVTLYDAPDGSAYSAQYENGVVLNGQFQYRDWMCVYRWEDGGEVSGWVPLSQLYLIYDSVSFEEEYGSRFEPYNGEFAGYDGPAEGIRLYEYPGYGWPKYTLSADQQDWLDCLRGTAGNPSYISQVYRDDSRDEVWGYVGYLYGMRDLWVCLNNPTRDGVMNCSDEESVVRDLIASGGIVSPQTPVPPSGAALPYILVVGVVAVTAALLFVFYGKKRKM